MSHPSRHLVAIALSLTASALPGATFADGPGSASSSTAADTHESVFNPKFDSGVIDLSAYQLKLEAGVVLSETEGSTQTAGHVSVSANHPIYIIGGQKSGWDDSDRNFTTHGMFRFKAGGGAELDFRPGESVTRLELEAPSLALLAMGHKVYAHKELVESAKKLGFTFDEIYDLNAAQLKKVLAHAKPTFTLGFDLSEVAYHYRKNKTLDSRESAAEVTFLNFNFHKAFNVNGVNVDLCGHIRPLGILAGETKIAGKDNRDPMLISSGGACLGVQAGELGQLRGSFDYRYANAARGIDEVTRLDDNNNEYVVKEGASFDDTKWSNVAVTGEISKILGTPLGLVYEYNHEVAQSGGADSQSQSVDRHVFSVKGAF